jgi:hypothetical protein
MEGDLCAVITAVAGMSWERLGDKKNVFVVDMSEIISSLVDHKIHELIGCHYPGKNLLHVMGHKGEVEPIPM